MWQWPEISLNPEWIIFLVFLSFVGIQLVYLLVFPFRVLIHKNKQQVPPVWEPLTVIICARNEEDNLFKHLPFILEQDYPTFEVIVVNDQSIDDSVHIIKAFQKQYSHLKLIELERNKHRMVGKKLPLTVGIKGAKFEHLILTDADCYPSSNQWLKKMSQHFSPDKKIVLGYGPYETQKGLVNKLIRFDTTSIAIDYFSMAKTGLAYMGVGRNMGYSKTLFESVGGFKSHYHIASGDDDLFVKEAATRKNVAIEMSAESWVYSKPKTTFKSWIAQKQRHYTTSSEYRLINKLFLGIFPFSLLFMYLSFVTLLFYTQGYALVIAIFGARLLLYWLIKGLLFKRLGQSKLGVFYPLYELGHAIIMPLIFYSNTQTNKW